MTRVLQVLSAARVWTLKDGTRHPTGFWAEEFVVPYTLFTEAGWHVTLATPAGTPPVVDQLSLSVKGGVLPPRAKKLRAELDQLAPVLAHPIDLSEMDPDEFDVVFYSGGHGPMEDLAADATSGALLTKRLASGKPLALLCHAPAASLAAKNPDGSWPFTDYRMTGLSNTEERLNPFAWKAKWLLEDRLQQAGANYTAGLPLRPKVIVDRNLYTGQNPASSAALARRLITDIPEKK
jgi:putative intracellular protease/amidase